MRWFTADTHFNHGNVIEYDQRPFNGVQQMNDEMIRRWNNCVKEEDTVYHLGDFCFGSMSIARDIFKKLKGRKILIRGNHDGSEARSRLVGWDFVCNGLIIKLGMYPVMLTHYPAHLGKDFIGLHGHTHKHLDRAGGPEHYCVSCNLHNYQPLSEVTVKKKLRLLLPTAT